MSRTTLADRVVSWMSPERGLARQRARLALETITQHYDGATRGRRAKNWRIHTTDAPGAARGQLGRLRDVSRDMVRNNAHAARAMQVISTNVVGAGIIPSVTAPSKTAKARLEGLAVEHLDTTAIDAAGQMTLYGLQGLAMRTIAEAGEVLIRRRRRRAADGLPLPFQLELLEPEFIDTMKDGPVRGSNFAVQGIEFDAIGRRVAYWLYDEHPASTAFRRTLTSRRVPASEIAHVYRVDRPGQVRGVPWLAPIVLRLNDFHDYEDAQLLRQKIAACYAAFVRMPDAEALASAPAEVDGNDELQQERFEPGMVTQLPPGWDVTIANPPRVDGYGDYAATTLRAVAAALGISYESLSGDLSRVNFSSARMGWLEMARNIDVWRWQMLVPQLCQPIGRWFLDAANFAGVTRKAMVGWTPPRREMIDPTREVPAMRDLVRAGFASRQHVIRENGFDPETVYDEIAEDNRISDERGFAFDSDGRQPAAAVASQHDNDPSGGDDEREDGASEEDEDNG